MSVSSGSERSDGTRERIRMGLAGTQSDLFSERAIAHSR